MLPQTFELPAAIVLVVSGAVACFAGYRLFRIVLAIYGFILGAMLASSMMGITNTSGMLVAGLVGGLIGALLLTFAYYVGIGIMGAAMAVFFVHAFWEYAKHADPPAVPVIVASIVGAIVAMVLQRYVIIISTAFSGAWTMILGVMATLGVRVADRANPTNIARFMPSDGVWILYPFTPPPGRWIPVVWLVLGLFGAAVQFGVTGRRKF